MAAHGWTDQEAAHADHTVQVRALLAHLPADPLVAIGKLDGRRTEAQATEPAVLGANEIAHLCAHQGPGSLGMFARHHLVPHAHLLKPADLDQLKCANLAGLLRNIQRCRHSGIQPARTFGAMDVGAGGGGQHEMTGPLEFAQRLAAAADLWTAAAVEKPERAAHGLDQ